MDIKVEILVRDVINLAIETLKKKGIDSKFDVKRSFLYVWDNSEGQRVILENYETVTVVLETEKAVNG